MTFDIKELIALADHLDEKGEFEKAAAIDGLIEGLSKLNNNVVKNGNEVSLDLPEYEPVESYQETKVPLVESIPGAREQSSTIPKMVKEFLSNPTAERYDELVHELAKYIKWSEEYGPGEGGIFAGLKNQMQKHADYEDRYIEEDEFGKVDWVNHILTFLDVYFKHPHENNLNNLKKLLDNHYEQYGVKDDEGALPPPAEHQELSLGATGKTFEKLADLADRLDKVGAIEEANLIDNFIKKQAEDFLDYKGEGDTEQSKRYDSKYHHSLQTREPKTEQERIDREGRDKHHVNTQQHVDAGHLSIRHCPQHIGVMMGRIGENTYQCPIDGQVYNWETGWTDYDGNEHPGSSVAAQTPDSAGYSVPHRLFDSREKILNVVN
jgi:hypothetical protein